MLSITVRLEDGRPAPAVNVEGTLDVGNATEFTHLVRRLGDAIGGAQVNLTSLAVVDDAGRSAVRHLARHAEEFGGRVLFPEGWVEAPRSADEAAWRSGLS